MKEKKIIVFLVCRVLCPMETDHFIFYDIKSINLFL